MRVGVRRQLAGLAVTVVLAPVAAPVWAQDAGSEEATGERNAAAAPAERNASRGRRLKLEGEGLEATVERPDGWVSTETGTGALATLRAASDKRAQIEIRVSSPIKKGKKESFFNSFHSKLKSAGFVESGKPSPAKYGGKNGREYEYEGDARDGTYRLVVWQFYRDEAAWIVAGFFPADRRNLHYEDFQKLAESLTYSRTSDK